MLKLMAIINKFTIISKVQRSAVLFCYMMPDIIPVVRLTQINNVNSLFDATATAAAALLASTFLNAIKLQP